MSNIFGTALEILRERGWQREAGALEDNKGRLCILGACSLAKYGQLEDEVYEDYEILDPLKKILMEQYGVSGNGPFCGKAGPVFDWNDSLYRTQDEVEAVLEKAAVNECL